MSIICQKNVHSLKNLVLSCHFFQLFHENPLLSFPYLVKNGNSVKTTQYYGSKKSIGYFLFSDFLRKNHSSNAHICQKKMSILLKTHSSHAHNLSKKLPYSQSHSAFLYCLKIGRFLTKYGHESSNFFLNRQKKGIYRLIWPIIQGSFDKINLFFDEI